MQHIAGYVRVMAGARVKQQVNKPLLRKPYLKYGQCFGLWGYFFQIGGILGAKYSDNLDAFGHAFLGCQGPAGAIRTYFSEVAELIVSDSDTDSIKFSDFVIAEFMGRLGYTKDTHSFLFKHMMKRMDPITAQELAWQYSEQGAALGVIYPQIVQKMFELTHAEIPKEEWKFLHATGLNIPSEQNIMTYTETEEAENNIFMEYCQECCPDHYSTLTK